MFVIVFRPFDCVMWATRSPHEPEHLRSFWEELSQFSGALLLLSRRCGWELPDWQQGFCRLESFRQFANTRSTLSVTIAVFISSCVIWYSRFIVQPIRTNSMRNRWGRLAERWSGMTGPGIGGEGGCEDDNDTYLWWRRLLGDINGFSEKSRVSPSLKHARPSERWPGMPYCGQECGILLMLSIIEKNSPKSRQGYFLFLFNLEPKFADFIRHWRRSSIAGRSSSPTPPSSYNLLTHRIRKRTPWSQSRWQITCTSHVNKSEQSLTAFRRRKVLFSAVGLDIASWDRARRRWRKLYVMLLGMERQSRNDKSCLEFNCRHVKADDKVGLHR